MWLFIRHLLQLLLSPARGWEDISEAAMHPDEIQRGAFFPWIGVVACSELLRLIYDTDLSMLVAVESAIAVGGAMFASLFLGRLVLDFTLFSHVDNKMNMQKVHTFALYVLALGGLFRIIANALPASMTFLKLLPLISLLIVFKSMNYVGVKSENSVAFVSLSVVALIIIPSVLYQLLLLFV